MTETASGPMWRVLGALNDPPKKSGSGFEARCPAHDDAHASLSIGTGLDGRVLLNCHAGCPPERVVAALGLEMGDLFEKSERGNPVRRFRLIDSAGSTVAVHVREDLPGDKKIWWEARGKRGLNGTALADLPLYRLPDVLKADLSTPVIVCEGEKAADALAELGLLAVGTVTGAAGTPSSLALAPLAGREVWLWPDNDDTGRAHMARIAAQIKPAPKWIDWKDAPPKGDAADYVEAGGTKDGVAKLLRVAESGVHIWRGDELARARFDPVRWAIPGILPSGLTILAGRPKLGKSWLVLGWTLDVARGGSVLRKIETEPGDALYLALEDSPRRMQERMAMMLGDVGPSPRFHVATDWPRMDEGGLGLVEEWIDAKPNARLIVIDTFKRFRPKETKMARLYDLDYDAISPVAALAIRRNVAIVVVFHTNKTDPSDPIDLVSGTLGLSGAADGVLVLKRERGQADASLFVTGRDVEEQDFALKWEKEDTLGWALLGNADQFRQSKERREILDAISTVPGMKPHEIGAAVGKPPGTIRRLLFKMVNDGQVRLRDGGYWPVLDTTGNGGNAGHTTSNGHAVTPTPVTVTDVYGVTAVTAQCRVCGNELPPYLASIGLHMDCVEDARHG